MINFFKKEEQKPNQLHSITFRVTLEDKNKLLRQATGLKISLSEYVRNKAMINETQYQKILDENERFKNQIKEYEITTESKPSQNIEPGSIVFKTTDNIKELLKEVFSQMRWNRFSRIKKEVKNENDLSSAIGFTITEGIVEPMNDMEDLRIKYNINNIEELFNKILVNYL